MAQKTSGTIVIVGASSGIGEALAMRLAHEARPVAVLARREDRLADLCDRIRDKVGTGRAQAFAHDVLDTESVAACWDRIESELEPIDEVFYCSGVMPEVGMDEFPTDKDEQMLRVNALGCMAWGNEAARRFLKLGRGHFTGVSSVAGIRGRLDRPGYNASKAAQDTYLEALRNRLWRHGIRVTTVRPGPVKTEMTADLGKLPLLIDADRCAKGIVKARSRSAAIAYTPFLWRPIMNVIQAIPSFIFRKLNV
ncbi:MAG: SDR family NAD(P)-dependent oxidoreductase [Planctomycetota bacterium]